MSRIVIIIAITVCLLMDAVGCVTETPKLEPVPSQPALTTTPSADEGPPTGLLAITSISPDIGPPEGGTITQISGENFTPFSVNKGYTYFELLWVHH